MITDNKINVLDHGFVRLVDYMGSDLSIVRNARVSYDAEWRSGEDAGKDEKLIRYLMKNHHTSPLESVNFTFDVKAPIFVFRQWHRHRTWCLSGDTVITFNRPDRWKKGIHTPQSRYDGGRFTLSYLYDRWIKHKSYRKQIKKMLLRVYDENKKVFTVAHIKDIFFSGEKDVFKFTTKKGYTLTCTKDHKLLTSDGWKTLEKATDLKLINNTAVMGKKCSTMINGTTALYQNKDWLQDRRNNNYSVNQIAKEAKCSYHTIRKWLKIHNLKFTSEERNFKLGHKPWNKDKFGYSINIKHSSEGLQKIKEARSGIKSNFWKGGVTTERNKIARWTSEQAPKVHKKYDYVCQCCKKRGGKLHAHHIKSVVNFPKLAYDFNNLITLCKSCHIAEHRGKEMSRGKGIPLTGKYDEIIKVEYIGKEKTYDIEVAGKHHNFIANGLVVHNCYNEVSARYSELPAEMYVPLPEHIGVQSKDNKQMRDFKDWTEEEKSSAMWSAAIIQTANEQAYDTYKRLIARGVPRELARGVLPVNTYSHMFATVDLHNLFGFLRLRLHEHAQYEIRVYAEAMLKLIEPVVPVSVQAFKEFVLGENEST